MEIQGILEASLYCDDLESAERFYEEVLELRLISRQEGRHAFFRCGEGVLLLFDPDRTSSVVTEVSGQPIPLHGARGPGHLAFRADLEDMDRWRRRLEEHGVEIESDVSWPRGGRSLYFRDPAGNSLEVATPELWDD
jgi:catechol 2,3-dioxygenase-like lactoylglutathione lyase family enzyme